MIYNGLHVATRISSPNFQSPKLITGKEMSSKICFVPFGLLFLLVSQSRGQSANDVLATRENFIVAKRPAFVMMPPNVKRHLPTPWVWYAPTLGKGLPGGAEKWMFEQFHRNGIAIAGIDVGESYGSPNGRKLYDELYSELTKNRGFSTKPVLLARSRGGLMLYSWAAENPKSVGGVAGIYPVCNLESYPGLKRAAAAFELSSDELKTQLAKHNPIDRLESLAKAKVPILHIHGDSDKVVPLKANSSELETRYKAFGGPVEIQIVKGQGHNMWKGWFESQKLTDFIIKNARKNEKADSNQQR